MREASTKSSATSTKLICLFKWKVGPERVVLLIKDLRIKGDRFELVHRVCWSPSTYKVLSVCQSGVLL